MLRHTSNRHLNISKVHLRTKLRHPCSGKGNLRRAVLKLGRPVSGRRSRHLQMDNGHHLQVRDSARLQALLMLLISIPLIRETHRSSNGNPLLLKGCKPSLRRVCKLSLRKVCTVSHLIIRVVHQHLITARLRDSMGRRRHTSSLKNRIGTIKTSSPTYRGRRVRITRLKHRHQRKIKFPRHLLMKAIQVWMS